jgi:signal transduction histidine kinase
VLLAAAADDRTAETGPGPDRSGVVGRVAAVLVRPRSIRAKLTRILVVSLVIVLMLLGAEVLTQISAFGSADRTSRIVQVTLSVQDAVHQLQKERGLTNGLLSGGQQFQGQISPQRTQTDNALAALNRTIDNSANADAGAGQVRTALAKLDGLTGIRGEVDSGHAQPTPTFQFYTDAIAALNTLELGLDQAQDATLRHGLQALYALGAAKESAGQERGLLNGVFVAGRFTTDSYTRFAEILGQKQAGLATYTAFASPQEQDALSTVMRSVAATQASGLEGIAAGGADGAPLAAVDPVTWWDTMTTVINGMRTAQQSVGADVTARADTLRSAAADWLIGIAILSALIVGVVIALVVGAALSVIGPLGVLAREANEASAHRLPDAVARIQTEDAEVSAPPPVTVPPRAATEITLVAQALDRVQQTALALAGEQALIRHNTTASLANLGRRNQNLVRRQLSLISEFERDELDPGALANMFELDHLATRMRRNAESLLVLVGDTSPRPRSEPFAVADAIRAALSEVEEYRRVVLRRVDEAWVVGAVVTEVAHMLAELVENGLSFSPPDLEVEIYGRRLGNQYLFAVVDYGIGMSPQDLAGARARLRDEENFLVAPTRFLGHYVVGRLARRLNVQVDLHESPVTGITARVVLPPELLAEPPASTNGATRTGKPQQARMADRAPVTVAPRYRWPERDTEPDEGTEPEQASSPVAAPPVAPATATGPERTKNGLVKRQSRGQGGGPVPRTAPPAPARTGSQRNRTPSEVGSMLSAFQRGHERGVNGNGRSAFDEEHSDH